MFRKFIFAVLAIGVILITAVVWSASPPPIISYQGKLLESGSPASTTLPMAFEIYDALTGGTLLYTASGTLPATSTIDITPVRGLFTVYLGDSGTNYLDPDIFKNNDEVYLQVTINGETLTPRKRITATPYAFNTKYLDGNFATSTPTTTNYIPVADSAGNFDFNDVTSTNIYVNGNTTASSVIANAITLGGVERTVWPTSTSYLAGSGLDLVGDTFSVSTSQDFSWTGQHNFSSTTFNATTTFSFGVWGADGKVGIGTTSLPNVAFPGGSYIPRLSIQQQAAEISGLDIRAASGTLAAVLGGMTNGAGILALYNNTSSLTSAAVMFQASGNSYLTSSTLFIGGSGNIGTDKLRVAGDVNITNNGLLKFGDASGTIGQVLMVSSTGYQEWLATSSLGINGGASLPSGSVGQLLVSTGGSGWSATDTIFVSTNQGVSLGNSNFTSGLYALALGYVNNASGNYGAVAMGNNNTASALSAMAIGNSNVASNLFSFALGRNMTVSGNSSFGINVSTTAAALSQDNTIALMGGNVGIGTVSPSYLLTVAGNTAINSGTLSFNNYAGINNEVLMVSSTGQPYWTSTSSLGISGDFALPSGSGGEILVNNGGTDWVTSTAIHVNTTTGYIGIGTITPSSKLTLENDGGILAVGTFGSGSTAASFTGTRMFWYPRKAAFRAGYAVSEWNDVSIGDYSSAFGYRNTASGDYSFVGGGNSNNASGDYSFISGGYGNTASGVDSGIINGESNTASGWRSFIGGGYQNTAHGLSSVAFGHGMTVNGDYSFGINVTSTNPQTIEGSNIIGLLGGNVGVGTTTPNYPLTVQGDVNITGNYRINGTPIGGLPSGTAGQLLINNGGTDWVTSSVVYINTTTGNVGVNTNTPSEKFTVVGNISNLISNNISLVSTSSPIGAHASWGRSIDVSGKYLYTVNTTSTLRQFSVIDIHNPYFIRTVATTSAMISPSSVFVSGKYAYLTGGTNSAYFQIIDISNPLFPTTTKQITLTNGSYPKSVFVSGKHAYISNSITLPSGSGRNFVSIVDISDPKNPIQVATTTDLGAQPNSIFVSDNYLYTANRISSSISIIDVSNPTSPITVTTTLPPLSYAPFSIHVVGKYLYGFNDSYRNFVIMDVSSSSNPTVMGYTFLDGSGSGGGGSIYVSGRYAFVTNVNARMVHVVDISSSTNPQKVAGLDLGPNNYPSSVNVSGKYAYVALGGAGGGINVIDISGTEVSSLIAHSAEAGNLQIGNDLTVKGSADLMSITAGSGGLISQGPGVFSSGVYLASSTPASTTNAIYNNNGTLYWNGSVLGATSFPSGTIGQLLVNNGGTNWVTSSALYVSTTANYVGIGTSTPSQNLTIQGGLRLTGGFYDSSNVIGANGMVLKATGTSTTWVTTSSLGILPSGIRGQILYNNGTNWSVTSSVFVSSSGFIGVGTTTPLSKLHIDNGGLLITGNTGATPVSGTGTRFMWIPSKNAFRAGTVNGNSWDNTNIGNNSFVFGNYSTATGTNSITFGSNSINGNDYSVVLGYQTTNLSAASLVFGRYAYNEVPSSVILGPNASVYAYYPGASSIRPGIAIGSVAKAYTDYTNYYGQYTLGGSIAIGENAEAQKYDGIAIGSSAKTRNERSVAIGQFSETTLPGSIALGFFAKAYGTSSLAINRINVYGQNSAGISLNGRGYEYGNNYNVRSDNVFVVMGGNFGVDTVTPTEKMEIAGAFKNIPINSEYGNTIKLVTTTHLGFSTGAENKIISNGRYLYIAAGTTFNTRLFVIDNNEPTVPKIITSTINIDQCLDISYRYDGELQLIGNYLYVGNCAFDVSNPAMPMNKKALNSFPAAITEYVIKDKYAYFPTRIYSLEDPLNPRNIKTISSIGERLTAFGKYIYSISSDKLIITDISDPINPIITSTTVVSGSDTITHIAVQDSVAYLTVSHDLGYSHRTILYVVDIIDKNNPVVLATTTVAADYATSADIEVNGNLVHVLMTEGNLNGPFGGISTFNVKNPSTPTFITSTVTRYTVGCGFPNSPGCSTLDDLEIDGRYAYVIDQETSKLYTVDLFGVETSNLLAATADINKLTINNGLINNGFSRLNNGLVVGGNGIASFNTISAFVTNSQYAAIFTGGNVGIGTTTPGYPLTVSGDVNITGNYRINGTALTSVGSGTINGQTLRWTGSAWTATDFINISGSAVTVNNSLSFTTGSMGQLIKPSALENLIISGGDPSGLFLGGDLVLNPGNDGVSSTWSGNVRISQTGFTQNSGKVTIGDLAPILRLSVRGGIYSYGDPMAWGGTGEDGVNDVSTSSMSQLIWYPANGSFRAGYINDYKYWAPNHSADFTLGDYSAAFGYDTRALKDYSFAAGVSSTANGVASFALGDFAVVTSSNWGFAFGRYVTSSGDYAFALGNNVVADGANSYVLGQNAAALNSNSYALGKNVTSSANYAYAFGRLIEVGGTGSFGISLNDFESSEITEDNLFAVVGGTVAFGATSSNGYQVFINAGASTTAGLGVEGYIVATGYITGSTTLDLAEKYSIEQTCQNDFSCPEAGDLVCIDENSTKETVKKCVGADNEKLIGAVSTKPGFVLGGFNEINQRSIALSGRVPVKVTDENGAIKIGDRLAISKTIPGYAKKADNNDTQTIGLAMDSNSNSTSTIVTFLNLNYQREQRLTIEDSSGQIVYTVDMGQDMLGRPLLNVASIVGVDNKWEIDTNGTLITKITTSEGTEKKLYGMSSENIEITLSGTSTLENGEARIVFATDTQEIIDETQPIKVVFSLTSPFSKNIYVSEKSKEGFVLKEVDGTDSGITFDWMVLAKRKFVAPFVEEIINEETPSQPSSSQEEGGEVELVTETGDGETTSTEPAVEPAPTETSTEPVIEETPIEPVVETPPADPAVETPPVESPSEPIVETVSTPEAPPSEETPVEAPASETPVE